MCTKLVRVGVSVRAGALEPQRPLLVSGSREKSFTSLEAEFLHLKGEDKAPPFMGLTRWDKQYNIRAPGGSRS